MSAALFSLSLEQDIIGAIMENKIAFDTVSGIVNDSDFYDLRHASFFALSPTCRNTTSHTTCCLSCTT